MKMIVAVDREWGIGNKGDLLARIRADLMNFRNETAGKTVVLGSNTLATFPGGRVLKNRTNLVLHPDPAYAPEGAIVALPMRSDGMSRGRAFGNGIVSGIVEPVAALLMVLLYEHISPTLPYLLAFSAGAMLYVVVEELIPETQQGKHSNIGTIAFALGFVVMMILDVALG